MTLFLRFTKIAATALCFVALCVYAGPYSTALAAAPTGQTVSINFNNVDLPVVVKFFSELTGKNFIVDQKVTGKVTAYSPTPISVNEAYQVFLTILEVNKYRIVQSGSVYTILPDADARVAASATGGLSEPLRALPAELVTRVIPLRQSSATELGKFLPQMLGDQGVVSVYAPSNTLIVTTSTALMRKVLTVVNEVDQGRNQPAFRSFSLQHANARTAADKINRMLQARTKRGETTGQTLFAVVEGDDRTGRVVVMADPDSMQFIDQSLRTFDQPTTPGKGDMRVIQLKFASAEDLATVLNNLVTKQSPRNNQSNTSGQGAEAAAGQEERTLVSDVSVVADKASNSLLVAASPRDFDTIRELVAKLDVERRQVYVEALIIEVSTETVRSLGVNWYTGGVGNSGGMDFLVFGGSRPNTTSFGVQQIGDTSLLTPPAGGSLGIISAPLTFAGMAFTNINAMANFMRSDNRFQILATPQLMTLDNEEATVVVAENIPFLTQTAVGTSTTDRMVQTVDYRDVGITLKILPQVASNGKVKMKIQQIVSRIASQGIVSQGQTLAMPTTRRREVNTRVVLEDGQTLVIAGLIAKDLSDTQAKVPVLGDIPVAGWLFKTKDDKVTDTNLLLFLTPKVILNKDDAQAVEVAKRQLLNRIETGTDGRASAARLPMRTMGPRLAEVREGGAR